MTNNELYRRAFAIHEDFKGIDCEAYYYNNDTKVMHMMAVIAAKLVIDYLEEKKHETV